MCNQIFEPAKDTTMHVIPKINLLNNSKISEASELLENIEEMFSHVIQ